MMRGNHGRGKIYMGIIVGKYKVEISLRKTRIILKLKR
jgi:hypothetical protein